MKPGCLLALFLVAFNAALSGAEVSEPTSTLRVVIKPVEPFVIGAASDPAGFSIDLWNEIALELHARTQWVNVNTVADQLKAVKDNAADVAIAAISTTAEREKDVDFSHPYFNAGLQIMVSSDDYAPTLWSRMAFLFAPSLLQALCAAIIMAILMAHGIWLAERRSHPNFQRGYVAGVWEGLWWMLKVAGNAEYGDRETTSVIKRLMTFCWWIVCVLLVAQLTASFTSEMTVRRLTSIVNGPQDLPGKRVATVRNSTAAEYLDRRHISATPVESFEQAAQLLLAGKVDAVVYDGPILRHFAANRGAGRVGIVGPIFRPEDYSLAVPNGSPLRKQINAALLKIREDGRFDTISARWFGASQ